MLLVVHFGVVHFWLASEFLFLVLFLFLGFVGVFLVFLVLCWVGIGFVVSYFLSLCSYLILDVAWVLFASR